MSLYLKFCYILFTGSFKCIVEFNSITSVISHSSSHMDTISLPITGAVLPASRVQKAEAHLYSRFLIVSQEASKRPDCDKTFLPGKSQVWET